MASLSQKIPLSLALSVGGKPVPAKQDGSAWPFSALIASPKWTVDGDAMVVVAADGSTAEVAKPTSGAVSVSFTGVNAAGNTVSASASLSFVEATPAVDGASVVTGEPVEMSPM
jgi:hypothetical protein